jgi:hypothetical protein
MLRELAEKSLQRRRHNLLQSRGHVSRLPQFAFKANIKGKTLSSSRYKSQRMYCTEKKKKRGERRRNGTTKKKQEERKQCWWNRRRGAVLVEQPFHTVIFVCNGEPPL